MKLLEKLNPEGDLNEFFTNPAYFTLPLGELSLPTGKLIACDPLGTLGWPGRQIPPFAPQLPKGVFPVTVSVAQQPQLGPCLMAARVEFSRKKAVRYQLAMRPGEEPGMLEEGEVFGFPVDSGLACFCDASLEEDAGRAMERWRTDHPEKLYEEYFAPLFERSYQRAPAHQRPGGDWLNWRIPGGRGNAVLFASGFGEGYYPVYFGLDSARSICCAVAVFIYPSVLSEMEEEE